MGHTTHGLAQVPAYLSGLESGAMLGTGEPITVSDRGVLDRAHLALRTAQPGAREDLLGARFVHGDGRTALFLAY